MPARKKAPQGPVGFAPPVDHEQLALDKLAKSGLTKDHMKRLRMEALSPEQTQRLHPSFKQLASLKIPYFRPDDLSKPLAANNAWPQFYRIRYLRPGGDQKDDIRYTNEPASGAVAYFPSVSDWPTIINDPDQTLIITEGELKAAKASAEGFPTIGLGGVWNFRSSSMGVTFLPELELFDWVKRRVYIAYDSDVVSKPGVQMALNTLAEELMLRGAIPFVVYIPEGDNGEKQGLDDWCVNNPGSDIFELTRRRQPLTQVKTLFEMNEQLVYVRSKGIVVEQQTSNKFSSQQLKEVWQSKDYAELNIDKDGNVSMKKAPVAPAWLAWPLRRDVNSITYKPGAPRFVDEGCAAKSAYNLWPGWGCQPQPGDVQPFLDLVDHLFTGAPPEAKRWFLRWCAYPIQYPGTKMFTAVLIHGIGHGTGKSLLGYTLGRIYGENFTEINQTALHGGFNAWAEAKQLVMGDDVTGSNKRADNDLLKKMITQLKLRVNAKFMPEYEVPDCINYYFTSNHPDAFFLEDDDRRYFIHEVMVGKLDESFYMDYALWLDTTGPSALFDWLLRYDLGDFNPAAPALYTTAKDQMAADTRSDLGTWVRRLKTDPDSVLRVGEMPIPGDLFTTTELLRLYDPAESKRTTANGLGRELRRAGMPRAHGGLPIRGPQGADRYYIIRNPDKWLTASAAELSKQLHLQAKPPAQKKY